MGHTVCRREDNGSTAGKGGVWHGCRRKNSSTALKGGVSEEKGTVFRREDNGSTALKGGVSEGRCSQNGLSFLAAAHLAASTEKPAPRSKMYPDSALCVHTRWFSPVCTRMVQPCVCTDGSCDTAVTQPWHSAVRAFGEVIAGHASVVQSTIGWCSLFGAVHNARQS